MTIVVVVNPKGGVGKSTLSTNIAGYFASTNRQVMLGDTDAQQSSRHWLTLRPDTLPKIRTWDLQADLVINAKPPKGITHVVVDTAGGVDGWRLKNLISKADKVLVPLQSSVFDMFATHEFLKKLRILAKEQHTELGIIGMRVDQRTISAGKLREFTATLDIPVISYLRDTQYYVHLAAHGLSMFDIAPSKVDKDLLQWKPICQWLDQ
jgi:chromosome partitioning protein